MGLYNSSGTRLGMSANLATTWATATGVPYDEADALSGGPFTMAPNHPDDWGWVVFLVGNTSSVSPGWGKRTSTAAGTRLSTGPHRSGYISGLTGQTTLPGSIVTANIDNTGYGLWVALS
jgi:hypothetical protein